MTQTELARRKKIALGSDSGPATVWDAITGEQLMVLPGNPDTAVYRVAFNPDGSRLATVGEDGLVRIWDVETGELLLRFTGHTEGSSAGSVGTLDVEYSPDGSQLPPPVLISWRRCGMRKQAKRSLIG